MRQAVVVTGASGGIGRACVARLASLGYEVVGTVRRDFQAAALGSAARCVAVDLADPETLGRAAEAIRDLGLPVRALVNNAGASRAGALEDLPFESIREMLEINLLGPLALTRALLPDLRVSRGRIVNVGSGEGFLTTPLNAPYCMAKHALEALSAALRLELAPSGVAVCVVSPGQTETPMLARARAEFRDLAARSSEPYRGLVAARARLAERAGAPPERVAEVIARAVHARRPRSRYFVGPDSRGAYLLGRVAPEPLRAFLYRALLGFG